MCQQTGIKGALDFYDSKNITMKLTVILSIVVVALLCVGQSNASDAEIALNNEVEAASPIDIVATGSDALAEVDALGATVGAAGDWGRVGGVAI